MLQVCECGKPMDLIATYKTPDFSDTNNRLGRMATCKRFKCSDCGKERIVNGRGKEVK